MASLYNIMIKQQRSTLRMDQKKEPKKALKTGRHSDDVVTVLGNRWLNEVLTETHITSIKKVFFEEESKQLNSKQLRKALLLYAHVAIEDEQYELIFRRMNIKRDGYVTWDEFISHLLLGFKIQEVTQEVKDLNLPISRMPRIVKSNHRHPINCITFNFQVKPDRSYSYSDGSYITCSKDGFINYWSLDMQIERTVQSKSLDLKVTDTNVLCVACLPDVSVICTGSTERELRFYDTSARKFELRVQVVSMEYAVRCMSYVFSKDVNQESKLILGDIGGSVRIILFSPANRGPFRSRLGIPLLRVKYENLVKGCEPGFKVVEFKNIHSDWVRQVEYYYTLNFIVSCSSSPRAIVMRDINEDRGVYGYFIPKGAWCFGLAEGFHLIATGGPDCLIRIWNPYVQRRPLATLHGHHTGILSIIVQDKGDLCCSLSEDKCIRVWDIAGQVCIQTYLGVGNEVGEYTELTMYYNPESRQILVGGMAIAVLPFRPLMNAEHTDGNTHYAAISVVLYNPLFKIILTCGLDSFIIVWDPWSGKRLSVVKDAHTRMLHGEILPVDITAATFDPGHQLLLTGAYDGSLKTWNFNTGTCLRNMRIEAHCEVTGVVWVTGRILAIGWNKHVTEFSESGGAAGPGGAFSKNWSTRHSNDVLAVAARIPQTLATSTYNGELVLWALETGQPYKQYNVANPTSRIKITYDFDKRANRTASIKKSRSRRFKDKEKEKSKPEEHEPVEDVEYKLKPGLFKNAQLEIQNVLKVTRRARKLELPTTICPIRGLAVRCMLFLTNRPMDPKVGSLFVALENGDIQVWSHHRSGGYLKAFQAVHSIGDYVVSMATDDNNEFLFCGSTEGYIKTFLMKNYFSEKEEPICMPKYRLKFPFLWKTTFIGRAQRALKDQPKPILLNSYRAHRAIVSGLAYINETEILVSSSADYSARLWTLSGRYLGTLGTFKEWIPLSSEAPPGNNYPYTLPPDIKRVMSSTTYRVLMGYDYYKKMTKKQRAAQVEKEMIFKEGSKGIYGKKLEDPILGHYIQMPKKTSEIPEIELDTTFPYIPVYQHLKCSTPADIFGAAPRRSNLKHMTDSITNK